MFELTYRRIYLTYKNFNSVKSLSQFLRRNNITDYMIHKNGERVIIYKNLVITQSQFYQLSVLFTKTKQQLKSCFNSQVNDSPDPSLQQE